MYSTASRKRNLLFVILLSFVLVQYFQNCAPPASFNTQDRGSQQAALSPFLHSKIVINTKSPSLNLSEAPNASAPSPSQQEKSNSSGIKNSSTLLSSGNQLVVNIDNACARPLCELEKSKSSLTCDLYNKFHKPQMENLKQAYVWVLESSQSIASIDETVKSDPNQKCIIGVSQREVYKVKDTVFTTNDRDYKFQYYHKTIKGTDVYPFFDTALKNNPLGEVIVGVIDTGVDFTHPDFVGTLSSEKGKNVNLSDACPTTLCHFHGTFVSGIIAANRNNSEGGMGIAPNSVIYSYQIGNSAGQLPSDEIVNAMQRALADRVEIINLSLGGGGFGASDASLQASIADAINTNIAIVVAAGNSNKNITDYPTYPASYDYDSMIVVGSASPQDIPEALLAAPTDAQAFSPIKRDFYSNYSALKVDISAPGRQIYSTSLNKTYGIANGTSFSTPVITATLSLARGYLKTKNFDASLLSPYVMKSLLIKSADNLDSLNETINSISTPVFIKNRFLNLADFQKNLVEFATGVSSNSNSISLNHFESSGSSSLGLTLNFRVEVNTDQLSKNPTMRAYTNKAFKEETLVSECKIESGRTFCEFSIDATKTGFLIDPGIYFELTDSGGNVIATLDIKKTDLNWGSKQDSDLFGEINELHIVPGKGTTVRGWACLKGFPDNVKLEVRKDTPIKKDSDLQYNSMYFQSLRTPRQAKGRYLDQCASPEVNLGFDVLLNAPGKFYIVALHPTDSAKNKIIPVLKYNPGFEDTTPMETQDYVYVDPNWFFTRNANTVKVLDRSFSEGKLTLKLSYCAKETAGLVRPAQLALRSSLSLNHSVQLIQAQGNAPAVVAGAENVNASELQYFYQGYVINNSNPTFMADSDLLGGLTIGTEFSNINDEYHYHNRSNTGSHFLYWGLVPELPEITDLNKVTKYQIDNRIEHDFSVDSVFASNQSGSCTTPDIYTLNSSIENAIDSYKLSVGGVYRKDKYPVVQKTDQLWQFLDFAEFLKVANANKSNLTLKTLSAIDMGYSLQIDQISTLDLFSLNHFCAKTVQKLLNPNSNFQTNVTIFGSCVSAQNIDIDNFITSYNLQNTVVNNSSDTMIVLAENISPLKKSTKSISVFFGFTNGVTLGRWNDNEDFLFEYWDSQTSKWLIAPLDIIKQAKSSGGLYEGIFAFQVELSAVQSNFQWRIRGNKANNFKLTQMVMEAF